MQRSKRRADPPWSFTEVVGASAAKKGKGKATERPSNRVKEKALEEKPRLAKREVNVP
jgi:hypothetical protein